MIQSLAIVGTVVCIGVAIFIAGLARAASREMPTPVATAPECDVTACARSGIVPTTDRHGDSRRVCSGHHNEGILRGWWAA